VKCDHFSDYFHENQMSFFFVKHRNRGISWKPDKQFFFLMFSVPSILIYPYNMNEVDALLLEKI